MNQKGFATLEVILMVVVIGILATIAVPRFTDITTKANTAKVLADLSTLDTAISVYEMETGNIPATPKVLADGNYINAEPTPPDSGKIYIKATSGSSDTTLDVSGKSYTINQTDKRAEFGNYNSSKIGK